MEAKKLWLSKTFWLNVLMALAPGLPVVGPWIQENVAMFSMVWGGLAVVLRLVTKGAVNLVD